MNKKNLKLLVFILIVVLVIGLNNYFNFADYLVDKNTLNLMKNILKENLVLACIIYILVTVVGCVVFALPGVTFAIIAGILFGPILGTFCCIIAATIGSMLSFLLGRYFLKDSLKPIVIKNKYIKKWLFDDNNTSAIIILMITRLVPLFPYNIQNFAYGITDIKFSTYSFASFIFMLPGTAMYTIGTAGIVKGVDGLLYIFVALVIAIIVFGISFYLKRKYL